MHTNLSWYLIHCRPREDARALENLERQGFQCYRPVRRIERSRHGNIHASSESLFPGYLFIRLDSINDNWHPIQSTRGVNKIVRFGDYPLPVPDQLIEQIRSRLVDPTTIEPYLRPGQRVRITERPFSNLEAVFLENDGDARVILLLNILQQDQRISMPLSSVRRIG